MANYALLVLVVDAQSGAHAPFTEVSVTAVGGTYRDSVHVAAITDSLVRLGREGVGLAREHPGTYAITVTASGYAKWTEDAFTTVDNLQCGYATDTVVARLRRP
jgi:hypothetical protein